MTTDFDTHESNPTQSQYGQLGSVASTTDPSDSLIEWFVGNPPQRTYKEEGPRHKIAQCSELEPIPHSPLSPPLEEQGPQSQGNMENILKSKVRKANGLKSPHFRNDNQCERNLWNPQPYPIWRVCCMW